MAAVISRPPVATFGGDDAMARRIRTARAADRLLELRLPASEVTILQWTFDLLEGSMGLASNFGAQIVRCQEGRHFVADVDQFFGECCEIDDDAVCTWKNLTSVARAWSNETGTRVKTAQLRTWLADRGGLRRKRRGRVEIQGLRVKPWAGGTSLPPLSERMEPQTMHVGTPSQACKADDLPVEGWASWHADATIDGLRAAGTHACPPRTVRAARAALLAIALPHAVTLYRMYGADTSREFRRRYADLGDLAPLAEDTPKVQAHAAKLTEEARSTEHFAHFTRALQSAQSVPTREAKLSALTSAWEAEPEGDTVEECEAHAARDPRKLYARPSVQAGKTFDDVERHTAESKLTVTPREALSDLLESLPLNSKPRNAIAKEIREQAGRMLVAASAAYRKVRA